MTLNIIIIKITLRLDIMISKRLKIEEINSRRRT